MDGRQRLNIRAVGWNPLGGRERPHTFLDKPDEDGASQAVEPRLFRGVRGPPVVVHLADGKLPAAPTAVQVRARRAITVSPES